MKMTLDVAGGPSIPFIVIQLLYIVLFTDPQGVLGRRRADERGRERTREDERRQEKTREDKRRQEKTREDERRRDQRSKIKDQRSKIDQEQATTNRGTVRPHHSYVEQRRRTN